MDFTIDDIFTQVCELEGLLLVVKRHGDEVPEATFNELKRKAGQVAALVNGIPCPEPAVMPEPEPAVEPEIPVVEEPAVEPAVEPEVPVVVAGEEPLRVSDKLHRSISKDLRRALSLNDRFRFSRELFGNKMPLLDNALDTIEGMSTHEEAEAYLLGDLGLNPDDEAAAEFMTIVKNHFL